MASDRKLDVLMVSELPLWPLDQGFCVHGWNMARALTEMGLNVGLASMRTPDTSGDSPLASMAIAWPKPEARDIASFVETMDGPLSWPRRRLGRYLVGEAGDLAGVVRLVRTHRPGTVIGLGLHGPILLRGLRGDGREPGLPAVRRIWYAADELGRFHASCLSREPLRQWPRRLRSGAVHVAMERLFGAGLDGVIGVSPTDTRLLRQVSGVPAGVTIRNGVDLERFSPQEGVEPSPRSLAFWGRMDFEPNVDAVCWFAREVWPALRQQFGDATWTIAGKSPTPAVRSLSALPGVRVLGEVADIRPVARGAALAILPMRCGGGIKNKLLEAAAMGLSIVASPRAVDGLEFGASPAPMALCQTRAQWVQRISELWREPEAAANLGREARQWAQSHHDWRRAACELVRWLNGLPTTAQAVIPGLEEDEGSIAAPVDETPDRHDRQLRAA